ncbi:MAG TPA: hypothetical protein VLT33_46675, partial [Labilithrix sp.]|nr:hypothetical protein [Labilithrix sp.]
MPPVNPRAALPVSPAKAMTPRAPAVAPPTPPPAPVQAKKFDSEPPSGGWDAADADTVTSFPNPSELPAPTPRNLPPVKASPVPAAGVPATQASPPTNVPATPNSPGTVRGPYQTSPGVGGPPPETPARAPALPAARQAAASAAAAGGLGSAMREEVWAIVRAAVDEAVSPLLVRNKELEARVERAERFAEAAKGGPRPVGAGIPLAATAVAAPPAGAASAASRLAALGPSLPSPSIPVTVGPSVAPVAFARAEVSPGSETVPDLKPASPAVAHPVGPR